MIKNIFDLQNPWRFEKGTKFTFPLYSRNIEVILKENLKSEKILGLIGSRQVGKSFLLYRLIQHLLKSNISKSDIFYFNLDDNQTSLVSGEASV
ncbi:MAG: AAA family ATPase [Verrucomicrobiota bacterium]|nr:AAA family ATPase [Verrucomicrobiota bacterium]